MFNNRSSNTLYRIADITIDTRLNTIHKDGETHRLEPKVMQLLNLFVRHQGEVCSKQQILDEIWPRQIVADDAITRLIFVLRNTLGDDAKAPKFISTIPKKGYVFLVTAEPVKPSFKYRAASILLILMLGIFTWLYSAFGSDSTGYIVKRSLPVTHQEGQEYGYTLGNTFDGYFHKNNESTQLVINRDGASNEVVIEDLWNKRSLLIVDSTLFYVRYLTNQYQIIQQTLQGDVEILFESKTPIYSLGFAADNDKLLFNKHQNNEHTVLYQYSFISKKAVPVEFHWESMPAKIYSHLYLPSQNMLFFVGVEGRKPTIFGTKTDAESFEYEIVGFDKVTALSAGRTQNDLIVTGVYRFTQGIWSVSLDSGEISLIYSHPGSDIAKALLDSSSGKIYYSFSGRRVDIKAVDLQGNVEHLSQLNSTMVDSAAAYSHDDEQIYFSSDRSGDFELYSYQTSEGVVSKLTEIQASTIWHYSFSNDQQKVAIVYSTDHIRLGVVELGSGTLEHSIPLEEIMFPLGWSKNDENIYISEHRSKIAMYLFDANTLTIQEKREHLGLTAHEVTPGEVIAFDYLNQNFVSYNFRTKYMSVLSEQVTDSVPLAPFNTKTNGDLVMLLYADGLQKTVYRLHLSQDQAERKSVLVANLLQSGNMQSFSTDLSSILLADQQKNRIGDIIALQLE